MTPAPKRIKTTDGALRAARQIERDPSFVESAAAIIDHETGVQETLTKSSIKLSFYPLTFREAQDQAVTEAAEEKADGEEARKG